MINDWYYLHVSQEGDPLVVFKVQELTRPWTGSKINKIN